MSWEWCVRNSLRPFEVYIQSSLWSLTAVLLIEYKPRRQITEFSPYSSLSTFGTPMVSWLKEEESHNLNDLWTQDQGEIHLLELQTHLPSHSRHQAASVCTTTSIEFSLLKKQTYSASQLGAFAYLMAGFLTLLSFDLIYTQPKPKCLRKCSLERTPGKTATNRPGKQTTGREHCEQRPPIRLKGGGRISDGERVSPDKPPYVKPPDNYIPVRKQSFTNYGFGLNF